MFQSLITSEAWRFRADGEFWYGINEVLIAGTFIQAVEFNFNALDDNLLWSWNAGRLFLIPGFFLLGLYIGKARLLERSDQFWKWSLWISFFLSFATWMLENIIVDFGVFVAWTDWSARQIIMSALRTRPC